MNKQIILSSILVLGMLIVAAVAQPRNAYAQATGTDCTIDNLQSEDCKTKSLIPTSNICNSPTSCITWFVNVIFLIAVLLSFVYLVWGGIDYIMAGGDSAAAGAARTKLTNAVVGLVVVIVAWAISNFVLKFFGVKTEIPLNQGTQIERIVEV